MKQSIIDFLGKQSDLSWQQILVNIAFSALIGVLIYLSYYLSHRGTIYSKKFNLSLVVLTVLTGVVMTVIGNNLALSLGMVGALSIVRFRTAIKDARDTMYIFWAIVVGICCGVSDFLVAGKRTGIVFLILLIFGSIKNDKRMLLIIRADRALHEPIQATVFNLFERRAIMRVRNTTKDKVEMIYEISSEILRHAEVGKYSICDKIYELGAVEYVNVVMQNDEISG